MNDVTQMLQEIERGNKAASDKLLPLIYEELRRLAHCHMRKESKGHSIPATALAHDAYMNLVGTDGGHHWENRRHFFAAAARSMRNLLVDHARKVNAARRPPKAKRIDIDTLQLAIPPVPNGELLFLDEALKKLAVDKPRHAELVELRFFTGMTVQEAADTLGIAIQTAEKYWHYARARLRKELKCDE